MTEKEIIENLKKCPCFESCSRNLCLLDYEIHLRTGGKNDICKWGVGRIREKTILADGHPKEFTTGDKKCPPEVFKYIPKANYQYLNQITKQNYQIND
jgi:hypothetical protein